ncbi:MAG: hypothetical protein PHP26_04435 [Syntrophomonas sp.]|nr:hypothetical protein [Syntrophomonas sp.]MDD2510958.1 hypothetical protein [Syntrophomonas sp.]MDD3879222.1 hypothetical protein [Syntrophomonas sp.]MDD4627119.1 hypothetical protein [Syntrophomonas sp.]
MGTIGGGIGNTALTKMAGYSEVLNRAHAAPANGLDNDIAPFQDSVRI